MFSKTSKVLTDIRLPHFISHLLTSFLPLNTLPSFLRSHYIHFSPILTHMYLPTHHRVGAHLCRGPGPGGSCRCRTCRRWAALCLRTAAPGCGGRRSCGPSGQSPASDSRPEGSSMRPGRLKRTVTGVSERAVCARVGCQRISWFWLVVSIIPARVTKIVPLHNLYAIHLLLSGYAFSH